MAIAYYVLILACRKHGNAHYRVTNDIASRAWKIRLIERDNPDWDDLYEGLSG